MAENENEFEYGRGKRSRDDAFSLARYWQKGYGIDRFSPSYVTNCHSTAPQAVFKIISFGSAAINGKGVSSAKAMIDYVVNRMGKKIDISTIDDFDKVIKDEDGNYHEAEAQEFYTESGEILKGKQDVDQLYKSWSDDFKLSGSGRGQQRHLTHMLLSADVEPTQNNANSVLASAQKTLWEEFGQFGFEYLYVLHTDTEHPHVHCVLKNYNSRTKRKLRLDRHDLLRVRTEFGKQLTDRGLKKHIATLRRDRPETLLRVQDVISKIKNQEKLIKNTVNESHFYRRKSQLTAQLTKVVKQHDYSGIKIKFDGGSKQLKIVANKQGAHIEKTLKHLALDHFQSKSFHIGIGDTASIIIHDTNTDDISVEQRKTTQDKFKDLITEKENKQLAKGTKDVLPQYKSALIRVNRSIAWIKKNKQLTAKQKQGTVKELIDIKRKLLSHYDINEIQDASMVVSARVGAEAANEMLHIEKHPTTGKEFVKRHRSLQAFVEQQKDQIQEQIKTYKKLGDKDMVAALKGLHSTDGYKKYIKAQNKVARKVLERRAKIEKNNLL